jgi:hypothetical protein
MVTIKGAAWSVWRAVVLMAAIAASGLRNRGDPQVHAVIDAANVAEGVPCGVDLALQAQGIDARSAGVMSRTLISPHSYSGASAVRRWLPQGIEIRICR